MVKKIEHYLLDIVAEIAKVEEYTAGLDFDSFCRDTKTQDAVIKNFMVIGEAVNKIPKEFFIKHPKFPTREAIDMRNFLIHDYDHIDLGVLWKTINRDIPKLKIQISKIH